MHFRNDAGRSTGAIGLELDIIAAVVIGGASLNGGSGSVLGSMIWRPLIHGCARKRLDPDGFGRITCGESLSAW